MPNEQHEYTEMAALFAVGMLSAEEEHRFRAHLDNGCAECAAEVREFTESGAALPLSVEPQAPPARLRDRLLKRVQANTERLVVRADEGKWLPTGQKGVTFKHLFTDRTLGTVTTLLRMEPGSAYPPHQHGMYEQCMVLEGDVRTEDLILHAGDYNCESAGGEHERIYTQNGCLLLLISSGRDAVV